MNNTKRTLPAIAAILIAATLVVGGTFAASSAQSAFAGGKKEGNGNGNTVTIEKCKQRGSVSGFDNTLEQECQNLICTHPGSGATCSQEGVVTPTPQPTNKTCEQCFTTLLTNDTISDLLHSLKGVGSLEDLCAQLQSGQLDLETVIIILGRLGVDKTTLNDLIACLKDAGIVFGK